MPKSLGKAESLELPRKSSVRTEIRKSSAPLEQSRIRIMEIASRLFISEGYGPVTIERVAREARVSKTTVYKFVSSKEQLYELAVSQTARRRAAEDGLIPEDSSDLRRTFETIGRNLLQALSDPESLSLMRNVIAESPRFPQLAEAFHRNSSLQSAKVRLTKLLEKLGQEGRLSVEDPGMAASQFIGMVRDSALTRLLLGLTVKSRELERTTLAAADAFLKIYAVEGLQNRHECV